MMRRAVLGAMLLAVSGAAAMGCCGSGGQASECMPGESADTLDFVPRKGDLVFVAGGSSDFSQAITSATAVGGIMAFDHVGIIDVDSAGVRVVEASPRDGVTVTPWGDFTASSPRLMVVGVHDAVDVSAAVERAKECLGRPYDWAYGCGTDSIYCSELVQIAYLDAGGNRIFRSRPMNFLDETGAMPEFWKDLFGRIGQPVPQGMPGTNPNDMARDALRLSSAPPNFIGN